MYHTFNSLLAVQSILTQLYCNSNTNISVPLMFITHSDTVYHFCEGHDATSHACFGEAAHIAVTLHMHEEASYENLDPIETEIRRRVFWLLFGGTSDHSFFLLVRLRGGALSYRVPCLARFGICLTDLAVVPPSLTLVFVLPADKSMAILLVSSCRLVSSRSFSFQLGTKYGCLR